MGTTDAATDTVSSTSSGEGGQQQGEPCHTTNESACTIPTNGEQLYQFDSLCPHPDWCFYETAPNSILDQSGGVLSITANPISGMGSGWWNAPDKDFGPLLFKRLSGEFTVVTRLNVSGGLMSSCPSPNAHYKAAGLLLRDRQGMPAYDSTERFYKLEYGCMPALSVGGGTSEGFGTLWAQVDAMQAAAHLDAVTTPSNVGGVGLAICRRGTVTHFFFREATEWHEMNDTSVAATPMLITSEEVSVGMFAGTFYSGGQETVGEFEYIGFRSGSSVFSNCEEDIVNLDAALSGGG
jgi:hypothetical protein